MEYNAFWGDSVVINIEDNLPRTSLPIDWNDEFIKENGNTPNTSYNIKKNNMEMAKSKSKLFEPVKTLPFLFLQSSNKPYRR